MAGIGFLLRTLSKQNNLFGLVQAYLVSAFASTGPWLFTVIALGTIMLTGSHFSGITALDEFRVIIIYNFSFSLVMSAPICLITSRYLADFLHQKDASTIPGAMLLALSLLYSTQIPVVVWFYFYVAHMPWILSSMAVINFLLISSVWLIMVFITALKDYSTISWAFVIGMIAAVVAATLLAKYYAILGMLVGFNVGVGIIIAFLASNVFNEYPFPFKWPSCFRGYFRKYWEIALGGLIYNAAIWVDKWLMWFAPEATKTRSGMIMYPHYDSAMFLAYLTIIPSMAMFLFTIETSFFENYLRFYRDIQNKATFRKIQKNHYQMLISIFGSSSNFLVLQGSICLIAILTTPKILSMLGGSYQQIGIFRYGVLGALFHTLTIFLLTLLSYFDNRKEIFIIQILFLLTNTLFSWISLQAGFSYYGYGYFLSSLLTFSLTMLVTTRYLLKLPYHTFITTNNSILQ